MAGVFDRDREIILARARLGLEVPALRARLWEELGKAQDLMSGLIGSVRVAIPTISRSGSP